DAVSIGKDGADSLLRPVEPSGEPDMKRLHERRRGELTCFECPMDVGAHQGKSERTPIAPRQGFCCPLQIVVARAVYIEPEATVHETRDDVLDRAWRDNAPIARHALSSVGSALELLGLCAGCASRGPESFGPAGFPSGRAKTEKPRSVPFPLVPFPLPGFPVGRAKTEKPRSVPFPLCSDYAEPPSEREREKVSRRAHARAKPLSRRAASFRSLVAPAKSEWAWSRCGASV
ncbi:MAG: hypothetical protein RLZZ450_7697, partial [Pseudomonadota bacterium]